MTVPRQLWPNGDLLVPRLGTFSDPTLRVSGQATEQLSPGTMPVRYDTWLAWINASAAHVAAAASIEPLSVLRQASLTRADSPQNIINDLNDIFGSAFTISDEDSERVIASLFEFRYVTHDVLTELRDGGLQIELSNKTVPEMGGLGMLAGQHPFGAGATWDTVPGAFVLLDSGEKKMAVGAGDPTLISADTTSVTLKQLGRAMADIFEIGGVGWSDLPEVQAAFNSALNAGTISPYYAEAGGEGVQEFLADAIALFLTGGPDAVARTFGQDILNFLSDKNLVSPEAPWPPGGGGPDWLPDEEISDPEAFVPGSERPDDIFRWPPGIAIVALYEQQNPIYQVVFPITPSELPESADVDAKQYRIIGSGQHSFPDGRSERKYSLRGYFPGGPRFDAKLPHIHDWRPPQDLAEQIRQWMDRKTRLRYRSKGRAGFYDVPVYLSRYSFTRSGHAGDIQYEVDLTEWRTIRVQVDDGTPGGVEAVVQGSDGEVQQEVAEEPTPIDYTVKSGDTLWFLAKEFLGDSSRWPELYEENRDVIGADPHWIYPGQVFRIPGGTVGTEEESGYAPSGADANEGIA